MEMISKRSMPMSSVRHCCKTAQLFSPTNSLPTRHGTAALSNTHIISASLRATPNFIRSQSLHFAPTLRTEMASLIPSPPQRYDVFISHAGPDKHTIALPLRHKLLKHNILAFVDNKHLQFGDDAPLEMTRAMETALVGVFVLSPEYPSRKWPVKELQCFQRREREAHLRNHLKPILVPFFYRLSVPDCYGAFLCRVGQDGKSPFADPKTRFWERQKGGEPEANIQRLREAMEGLTTRTGVENLEGVTNEDSSEMSRKRDALLDEVCEAVREALKKVVGKMEYSKQGCSSELERDVYQPVFEAPMNGPHVSIDTTTIDSNGEYATYAGQVKMLVLQRLSGQLNIVAVHGTGGVGKTTTVKHIGNDEDVKRRFPDGILFVQLGQDGTVQGVMEEIIRIIDATGGEALAEKLRQEKRLKEVMKHAAKWFRGKSILLIFDDLWEEEGVGNDVITEACSIVSAGKDSAIMFTTRNAEIAQQAPGRQVSIRPRPAFGEEARGILFRAAGRPQADWDDHNVRRVILKLLSICNGLPIALVVTGKGVGALALTLLENKKLVWKIYGENIERCIQNAIRRGHGSYLALLPNVRATLNTLGKFISKHGVGHTIWEERFAGLCVLEKQGWAPLVMIKRLWAMKSLESTADAVKEMTDAGLLELDVRVSGEVIVQGIRMHDLLNDVATAIAKEKGGVEKQYAYLLDSYIVSAGDEKYREWWSKKLKADGYIHESLARHLIGAGLGQELVEVLMWPSWAKRRVEVGGAGRLEEDFEKGCMFLESGGIQGDWSFSVASYLNVDDKTMRVAKSLRLIKEAIQLGSFFMRSNPREVYFQLRGRLVEIGRSDEMVECYLKRIEKCAEEAWVRPLHRCLGAPGGALRGIISLETPVNCVDALRVKGQVVCGCEDGQLVVADVSVDGIIRRWQAHNTTVTCVAVSEDGSTIVSGSKDETLKVWKAQDGKEIVSLKTHDQWMSCLAVDKNGQRGIAGGKWGAFTWDTNSGECVVIANGIVRNVAIARNGQFVFVADNMCVRKFMLDAKNEKYEQVGGRGQSKKGSLSLLVDGIGPLNMPEGRNIIPQMVKYMKLVRDDQVLITWGWDKTIRKWNTTTMAQISRAREVHLDWFQSALITDDEQLAVTGSLTGEVRVGSLHNDGVVSSPLQGHVGDVTSLCVLDGKREFVSCSVDGTVRLWDPDKEQQSQNLVRESDRVTCVTFFPCGTQAFSGSSNGTLRVWDVKSGQQIGETMQGCHSWVRSVSVLSDGVHAISVHDLRCPIWNLASKELRVLDRDNLYTEVAIRVLTAAPEIRNRFGRLRHTEMDTKLLDFFRNLERSFYNRFGSSESRVISDEGEEIVVWGLDKWPSVHKALQDARRLMNEELKTTVTEQRADFASCPVSISLSEKEIVMTNDVEANAVGGTLETTPISYAVSDDGSCVCAGFEDGSLAFMAVAGHKQPS